MISAAAAREIVMAHVPVLPASPVPLLDALGLILTEDVVSGLAFPTCDSSAMDGFAVRVADVAAATDAAPVSLTIAFTVAAGDTADRILPKGVTCRIMTGARIPSGADAVIMLEDVTEASGRITVREAIPAGEFIRPCGEDLLAGATILQRGTRLTPPRLALLAAIGRTEVMVHRRPQVAILSTGDEVIEPGQPLQPGQIYNSNAYAMAAWIQEAGAVPVRMPIVPDSLDATRRLLRKALTYDAVVTSGGVSMGEFDFIGKALASMGTVHFTRVAQQPGKPFTFATVGRKPIFGLPGNPSATMVGLELYVRPALRGMMGHPNRYRPMVLARLDEALTLKSDRMQFLRARVDHQPGGYTARLTGPQGSGLITAMAWANALLVIPTGTGRLLAGTGVTAMILEPELLLEGGLGGDLLTWG